MLVKLKVKLATEGGVLVKGQTADLPEADALWLLKHGLAERADGAIGSGAAPDLGGAKPPDVAGQ
jgi:hypothetical protein